MGTNVAVALGYSHILGLMVKPGGGHIKGCTVIDSTLQRSQQQIIVYHFLYKMKKRLINNNWLHILNNTLFHTKSEHMS
jgi:hypothetical protein